jgi:hypothetical protein
MGHSRIDNPETLVTLDTQDTGRDKEIKNKKQEKNTTQKTKMMINSDLTQITEGESRLRVSSSCKTQAMLHPETKLN